MSCNYGNHSIVRTGCDQMQAYQPGTCRSRREFLSALGALAASAFVPTQTSSSTTKPGLIDLHHHILPPEYLAEARDRVIAQGQGFLPARVLEWSPQNSLTEMDQNGVAASIVSISTPGVWFESGPKLIGHSKKEAG